jgi:hypothetical protein
MLLYNVVNPLKEVNLLIMQKRNNVKTERLGGRKIRSPVQEENDNQTEYFKRVELNNTCLFGK